ncbi:MAG: type II secretion system F family protein [Candidatus Deferrimicrobium sp.]|nr:type II secretion system F family protein [Candidatus Deferrimicrobium sp.]
MRARDLFLIGAPMLLGGVFLAAFLLRTWKERPIARSMQAYRFAHDRLTEELVARRILRFPGACLVSSLRHWAFAELFVLLVFLAVVSGNRSASGIAQATAAAAPLGFGIAWISLRGAAREALRSVQRDLPVACFLFSLLLESGMGASSALQETSGSIPEGALARELRELVRSRSLGVPRGESIERSGRRVPVEDYRLFLNHVLQGERLGIGLSRSLRELSSKMLESQGHRAETIAQQAAVKMLFPLVFFIFPAVFLIILSPVILGLWDRLAG